MGIWASCGLYGTGSFGRGGFSTKSNIAILGFRSRLPFFKTGAVMRRIILAVLIFLSPSLVTAAPFILSCKAEAEAIAIAGKHLRSLQFRIDIERKTVTALYGLRGTSYKVSLFTDAQIVALSPVSKRTFTFSRYSGQLEVDDFTQEATFYYACKVARQLF